MRSFIKSSLVLSIGQISAQLLFIVFTPALTRIYGPEAFSYALTFYSLSVILGVIASGRLDLGVVVAASDDDAIDVYATGVMTTLCICGGVTVVVSLMRLANIDLASIHPILQFAFLFPIMGAVYSLHLLSLALSNRHRRYPQMSFALISGAVIMITYSLLANGGDGLLIGRILGVATVSLILLLVAGHFFKHFTMSRLNWSTLTSTLKANRRFPIFNVPYSSIEALAAEVFALTALYFLSADLAGYFVLIRLVLVMPISVASAAVGHVFFRDAVDQFGSPELERRAIVLWKAISFLMAPYFGSIIFFGPLLFSMVFGPEWEASGQLAGLYFPSALIIALTGFPARIYEVAGRQDIPLRLAAAYVLIKTVFLSLMFIFQQSNTTIIMTNAISDALYYLAYLYFLARIARFNSLRVFATIGGSALSVTIPALAAAYLSWLFLGQTVASVAIAVAAATVAAGLGLLTLRRDFARA